ncbi:unnamed protein product [Schistosoma mattheei]|uniref:C2H2-type domain-containing protein n=1 Tax=Schistosoma mattheei TaxID=31246 RepID=A0AA85ARH3_9TREM|nr:unnamed protein product [Schistosoma mattheei]
MNTTDLINKRKQLSNENDNNNEMGLLHSNGQSSISSLTTVRTSPQITITTAMTTTKTTTTTTVPSYCSTLNKPICSLCGEQFKEKHHLTRHMLSHT